MPFRIIPDLSERPEHCVQSARAKGADIFDDRPLRADFRDESVEFEPQAAPFSGQPGTVSGKADVLTGESAREHIGDDAIFGEACGCEIAHITIDGDTGPVLPEDL